MERLANGFFSVNSSIKMRDFKSKISTFGHESTFQKGFCFSWLIYSAFIFFQMHKEFNMTNIWKVNPSHDIAGMFAIEMCFIVFCFDYITEPPAKKEKGENRSRNVGFMLEPELQCTGHQWKWRKSLPQRNSLLIMTAERTATVDFWTVIFSITSPISDKKEHK